VKAVVTLHAGKTVTDKELVEHCRGKIAGYKIPKQSISSRTKRCP